MTNEEFNKIRANYLEQSVLSSKSRYIKELGHWADRFGWDLLEELGRLRRAAKPTDGQVFFVDSVKESMARWIDIKALEDEVVELREKIAKMNGDWQSPCPNKQAMSGERLREIIATAPKATTEMHQLRGFLYEIIDEFQRLRHIEGQWLLEGTDKEIKLEAEVFRLSTLCSRQRQSLHFLNQAAHYKNLALDALHYVWCSGGCPGGVCRYTESAVSEEIVQEAERNTRRLRTWWEARKSKLAREAPSVQGPV